MRSLLLRHPPPPPPARSGRGGPGPGSQALWLRGTCLSTHTPAWCLPEGKCMGGAWGLSGCYLFKCYVVFSGLCDILSVFKLWSSLAFSAHSTSLF